MLFIYVTFPNQTEAKKICQHLVSQSLAACVHITNNGLSIYQWENKIQEDQECLAFIKTKKENYKKIEELIKQKHSYHTPCIIAFKPEQVLNEYNSWLNSI